MPERPQSAASHARIIPIYHRFVLPVLTVNIGIVAYFALRDPGLRGLWDVLVAVAIGLGVAWGRVQALTAQDRVIRLEETLRMQRVLPATMHDEVTRLTRADFIALRFAPDDELPDLVRRVRAGELATPSAIKQAIRNWRPDHLRV